MSFFEERKLTLLEAMPLKATREPLVKPTPLMLTSLPATALVGEKPVTEKVGVNLALFVTLAAEETSVILAGFAPLGTLASISAGEITVKLAGRLPNSTSLTLLRALPLIVTEAEVMAEVGVKPVKLGTSELTTAVWLETAGAPDPDASLAISCTRMLEPTSAGVMV